MMITGSTGFLAFLFWWLASRHYPGDVEKVKGLTEAD